MTARRTMDLRGMTAGVPARAFARDPWVAPEAVAWSTRRLVRRACLVQIAATILLSRFALPFGAKQIPLTLVVAVALLALIALLTRGMFSPARLTATAVVFVVVLAETTLVHTRFSGLSVLYVLGIYGPLVVSPGLDVDDLHRLWRGFIGLASCFALLGLVQLAGQVAAGGYFIDPIEFVPEPFVLAGYQSTYPIMRGVIPTLKPNGMFLLEPSVFSQFLALALLGELWLFRRASRILLFATGLAVSFSGTGLLVLAAGLVLGARLRLALGLGVVGLGVAAVVAAAGFGEAFTSRVDEVRRPGTSGHERLVAPFEAMRKPWRDSGPAVLWGYGAGQVETLETGTGHTANYSAVPKVFLEYGLVGLLAFGALWLTMFGGLAVPRPIVGALVVMYFVAGGALLQPFTVFTLWGLTGGFMPRGPAPDGIAGEDRGPA